ncbi:MAG: nitroreductase family protein [Ilumatobacteraceae bacterium]
MLDLSPDQLLSTTRAVRKRLDLTREVDPQLIRECVSAALQAPSGSNSLTMQFVVVTDAEKRAAIGEIYRQCYDIYKGLDGVYVGSIVKPTEPEQAQQERVQSSADYLGEHMGDAPALVIACNAAGRVDGQPAMMSASMLANILPATWSFMLAARARGLGTSWTTVHLMMEQQVADVVGIPFDEVQQVCLSPIAHTVGTDFQPAMRPDPDTILHWDQW